MSLRQIAGHILTAVGDFDHEQKYLDMGAREKQVRRADAVIDALTDGIWGVVIVLEREEARDLIDKLKRQLDGEAPR